MSGKGEDDIRSVPAVEDDEGVLGATRWVLKRAGSIGFLNRAISIASGASDEEDEMILRFLEIALGDGPAQRLRFLASGVGAYMRGLDGIGEDML